MQAILSVKDHMSAALKGAASAADSLNGGFKRTIGTGALLQLGMRGVNMALDTMKSHVGSAVDRYDQLNNFPKVMKNLGIATNDTKNAMKDLDKGISGLPTTMDIATAGVTRFVSRIMTSRSPPSIFWYEQRHHGGRYVYTGTACSR